MTNLLRVKHWQLFIILTSMVFISIFVAESGLTIENFNSKQLSLFVRVIGIIVLFLWYLVLGLSLNNVKSNPYKFKSGLFVFAIIFCVFGYSNMNLQMIFSESYIIPNIVSILSGPLTLWGVIYVFYNISISFNSLESKRKVSFGHCIVDLILLLAFPIGVWIIQPRLNKLCCNKED